MITIQEILGTDSIAASRLTINSNFLLIENEINDLENTFNINVVTGSMDLSLATSGQIKSKSIYSNSGTFPASGTPTISLYGTGASAGNASFSGIVSTSQINVSGTGSFNQINASGPAVFDSSVQTNGDLVNNGNFISGPSGAFLDQNSVAIAGPSNPFAAPSAGGGGVVGTSTSPYALTFTESVIFANCSPNFYFYVATGTGGVSNPPQVPQGFRLTIINTSNSAGDIGTGTFGSSPGYYSGFNTINGQWNSGTIGIAGTPYKSSITLQWENRINKGGPNQNGSWVVISAVGITF
jgi:hypothetical protein